MALYWSAGLLRLRKTMREAPTARAGLDLTPSERSVCLVVPAHNEGECIGRFVKSLRAQDHPSLRVVLALDRCADDTEARAREAFQDDPRFEIVSIDQCPDDWAGKVNAIWQGVRRSGAARGADLLLFTDADTEFDPGVVRATAALLEHRELDILSLISTGSTDHWFERVVQPAAGLELIHQFPILSANGRAAKRPFANGQFILITREAYERLGGHEAVREALLEDLALARLASRADMRAGVFLADGLLTVHMYDTWEQFQRGWERIFIEACRRRVGRLRRAVARKMALGVFLPAMAGLGLVLGVSSVLAGWDAAWGLVAIIASIAGLGAMFLCLWAVYRASRQPRGAFLSYPHGAWQVARILRRAADVLDRREPVRWGGREYVLEPR